MAGNLVLKKMNVKKMRLSRLTRREPFRFTCARCIYNGTTR